MKGKKLLKGKEYFGSHLWQQDLSFFLPSMQTNWFAMRLNFSPLVRPACKIIISSVIGNLCGIGMWASLSIVYV